MYQQYRKVKESIYELIEISARFDDENKKIVDNAESVELAMAEIFADWRTGDVLVIKNTSIVYPILDSTTNEIREMTREEKVVLLNMVELLEDGEVVVNSKITKIEPVDIYQPVWNKELGVWIEGVTKEELIQIRTQKLLQYKEVKDNIATLEEFTEFDNQAEIESLRKQLEDLKVEINNLFTMINKLK